MADASPVKHSSRRAWFLLGVRQASGLIVTVVMWVIIRAGTGIESFPLNTTWATLGLFPVNVLCLVIVRKQERLFPVVITHWIVNIMMSSPAITLPILQPAGVVPELRTR